MERKSKVTAAVDDAVVTDRDYRDDLRDAIDSLRQKGVTRYRLCRAIGIDSGTLSNVLSKRRHFSIEKLESVLSMCGYCMKIERDPNASNTVVLPVPITDKTSEA